MGFSEVVQYLVGVLFGLFNFIYPFNTNQIQNDIDQENKKVKNVRIATDLETKNHTTEITNKVSSK